MHCKMEAISRQKCNSVHIRVMAPKGKSAYIFMELMKAWQSANGISERGILKAYCARLFSASWLSKEKITSQDFSTTNKKTDTTFVRTNQIGLPEILTLASYWSDFLKHQCAGGYFHLTQVAHHNHFCNRSSVSKNMFNIYRNLFAQQIVWSCMLPYPHCV
jgi:hypothetical protein